MHFRKHGRLRTVHCFTTTNVFLQLYLINTTNQIFRGSNIFHSKVTIYIRMYVCMYVTKYLYFQIKAVLLNFLFIRVLKYFTNILSSTTGFNIDTNNKCLYNSKSAYKSDFWRIMWDWRRVMILKNQLWHHRNKWHFKIYLKKHFKLY